MSFGMFTCPHLHSCCSASLLASHPAKKYLPSEQKCNKKPVLFLMELIITSSRFDNKMVMFCIALQSKSNSPSSATICTYLCMQILVPDAKRWVPFQIVSSMHLLKRKSFYFLLMWHIKFIIGEIHIYQHQLNSEQMIELLLFSLNFKL